MSFPDWAIGVILITVGSIGNNLGNNLMSLGHAEERKAKEGQSEKAGLSAKNADMESHPPEEGPNVNAEEEKPKRSWWLIGTIIFVSGALFTFASFGFGAQSLLASMESVQFVSNVVFVYLVHGQEVTMRMVLATLSIVGGNILVVIFSDHAAQLLVSADINHLYLTNTAYQVYAGLALALCGASYLLFRHYYHSRVELRRPPLWMHSLVEPLSYTICAAILGTQAVLQSKTLSMLLQATFRGDNQFTQPTVYIVLFAWLFFVSFWLNRLNRALDLFPPLFIIPVTQVFFVFFAILSGGIFFEEFLAFSVQQYVGFIVGVVLIFVGVYGLAPPDVQVYAPEDPFSDQIRPKRRASKMIEGQVLYQLPPNLPEEGPPVRRRSQEQRRSSAEKYQLLIKETPDLDAAPQIEIREKPQPDNHQEAQKTVAAGVVVEDAIMLPKTGTRKVYKKDAVVPSSS